MGQALLLQRDYRNSSRREHGLHHVLQTSLIALPYLVR
jgi:hypothetical protein